MQVLSNIFYFHFLSHFDLQLKRIYKQKKNVWDIKIVQRSGFHFKEKIRMLQFVFFVLATIYIYCFCLFRIHVSEQNACLFSTRTDAFKLKITHFVLKAANFFLANSYI